MNGLWGDHPTDRNLARGDVSASSRLPATPAALPRLPRVIHSLLAHRLQTGLRVSTYTVYYTLYSHESKLYNILKYTIELTGGYDAR